MSANSAALCDFNDEPLSRKGGLSQDADDPLGEPAVGELRRRDVDGDFDLRSQSAAASNASR